MRFSDQRFELAEGERGDVANAVSRGGREAEGIQAFDFLVGIKSAVGAGATRLDRAVALLPDADDVG